MAIYTNNTATMNFSDATWDIATNVPTAHAATNISVSTGGSFGATFTAPNTTNASTGVWICLATTKFGANVIATLYESGVATAATATITNAQLPATNNYAWIYFRWATPYTFTTTTAGAYKIQLKTNTSSGTVVADAAGTGVAFVHTDNRTGVPGSTDDRWIGGLNGNATPTTVTLTGTTNAFGSSGDSSGLTSISPRTIGHALVVGAGATVQADPTADCGWQPSGNVLFAGGNFTIGTSTGSPYAFNFTSTMNAPAINAPWGIGALSGSQVRIYGKVPTFIQTTLSSGVGTAASPLITSDAVNWSVGDEIYIAPTDSGATNYNNGEYRFIITVNSATSYVLSSTKGGTENALSANHTAAPIVHLTSNVIFTANNSTNGTFYYNDITIQGDCVYSGIRFEYHGSATGTNKFGVAVATSGGRWGQFDNCISYKPPNRGFWWQSASNIESMTGLRTVGATLYGFYNNNANNKTFTNFFAADCNSYAYNAPGTGNCIFNSFRAYACNRSGGGGAMLFQNLTGSTFTNCEFQATRQIGIQLVTSSNTSFINCQFGNKGTNVLDIQPASSTLNTGILFSNCLFGSATLISNYANQSAGSLLAFHKLNQTENNHIWYTNTGSARSSGSGLVDTTTRDSDSLAVRIAPENATAGFTWSFNIIALANTQVGFPIMLQRNSTFSSGTVTVSLTLPNNTSGTPDTSYTLPTTTGSWLPVYLTVFNTGTVPGLATITINAQTATAGAYLYADDAFNAGDGTKTLDKVGGFDIWNNGQPLSIISPLQPLSADIANAILRATTAGYNTGTVGNKIDTSLSVGKYFGLQ